MAGCCSGGCEIALVIRGVCEGRRGKGVLQVCRGGTIDQGCRFWQWTGDIGCTASTLQMVGGGFFISINHTGYHVSSKKIGMIIKNVFNNSRIGFCHGHGHQAGSCETSDELHFCCLSLSVRFLSPSALLSRTAAQPYIDNWMRHFPSS